MVNGKDLQPRGIGFETLCQILDGMLVKPLLFYLPNLSTVHIMRHSRVVVGLCRVKQSTYYPSSIWCRGLNSQPFDYEPFALTTRPWLKQIFKKW